MSIQEIKRMPTSYEKRMAAKKRKCREDLISASVLIGFIALIATFF